MQKVAVLGAGAIGGWLAAALAEAGVPVGVVARGATLAALRQQGLRIDRGGSRQIYRVAAGCSAELGPQDLVIIATKAQDVGRALPDLLPLLHANTTVVAALNGVPWWFTQRFSGPLQNVVLQSVDPDGAIATAIAAGRAVGCVVHASVTRTAPGCISVGKADRLIFGEPAGGGSGRVQWLAETFERGGVKSTVSDNIRMDTWAKLWGNMNMNPISALTRAGTARMLADAEVRTLCLRMMDEMAAVGARIGLPFAMSASERMAVTLKLGDFRTSMLQDLDHGASLEYQPQLGAVVEIARQAGVAAPYCESVLGLIRQLSVSVSGA
jgi:2-dehydropantoate 2-reductase